MLIEDTKQNTKNWEKLRKSHQRRRKEIKERQRKIGDRQRGKQWNMKKGHMEGKKRTVVEENIKETR